MKLQGKLGRETLVGLVRSLPPHQRLSSTDWMICLLLAGLLAKTDVLLLANPG